MIDPRTRTAAARAGEPSGGLWLPGLVSLLLALGIGWICGQRTYIGTGAEADFIGTFVPEALRVMSGSQLEISFHPPGYAFALAVTKLVTHDWMSAGLWISAVAALAVIFAGYLTFRRLAGAAAGWGAIAACATSLTFLGLAGLATSDMFFTALVTITLALAVYGLTGSGARQIWFWMGVSAAAAGLSRTNGIACALVLLAPILLQRPLRLRAFAAVWMGFAVPTAAWVVYAIATGSPIQPTENHLNLAVAAYSTGPGSTSEEIDDMESRFQSIGDVLMYDPARMVKQIAIRYLELPLQLARSMAWKPITLLAMPGALLLLIRLYADRNRAWLAYLAIVACLGAISAVHAYDGRFFLFAIPAIGALAMLTVTSAFRLLPQSVGLRRIALAAIVLPILLRVWSAYAAIPQRIEGDVQRELAEAVPALLHANLQRDGVIYERKGFVGFATGHRAMTLPDVETAAELREELCSEAPEQVPLYLFVGLGERRFRPALSHELQTSSVPWLHVLARGRPGSWTFYRIGLFDENTPSGCASSRDERSGE